MRGFGQTAGFRLVLDFRSCTLRTQLSKIRSRVLGKAEEGRVLRGQAQMTAKSPPWGLNVSRGFRGWCLPLLFVSNTVQPLENSLQTTIVTSIKMDAKVKSGRTNF